MEIDVERQQKAREYRRKGQRFSAINQIPALLIIFLFIVSDLNSWLLGILHSLAWQPISGWFPLELLAYFLILIVGYQLITLPTVYYWGFVLSHRYGLSTISLGNWFGDLVKGRLLNFVWQAFATELCYLLIAIQPQTWWFEMACVILLLSIGRTAITPTLLWPLFYKFSSLPDGELKQQLMALANQAKTPIHNTVVMHMSSKTTTTNAFLVGLGKTRRIILSDTMLDRYTPDEIETIYAHELGHHVHKDIWKQLISRFVLELAGLYLVNLALHWFIGTINAASALANLQISDPATIPLFLSFVSFATIFIMPISSAISRRMEYQADEFAMQTTGKAEAFKNAMIRLANQNLYNIKASVSTRLMGTHPATSARLKHADEFVANQASPILLEHKSISTNPLATDT